MNKLIKMSGKKNVKNNKKNSRKYSVSLIMGALLFVVWPCLVHMDEVKAKLQGNPWYPNLSETGDFFMHTRSVALIALAVCMAAVLIDYWLIQGHSIFAWRFTWPLAVYGGLALISALLSVDRQVSFGGMNEQFESIWVLGSYLLVFWFFRVMAKEQLAREKITAVILTGAGIQGLIGLSQLFGRDFWSSSLGQSLILLGDDSGQQLTFYFGEGTATPVYMSFYNPNYAAVYLVMMIPIALYGIWAFKKTGQKWMAAGVSVVLFACLWGTGSKAGFLAVILLAFAAGLFLMKNLRSRALFSAGVFVCLAVYCLVSWVLPGTSRVEKIVNNIFTRKRDYSLTLIEPGKDDIHIRFKNQDYYLSVEKNEDDSWFVIKDENGTEQLLGTGKETGRMILEEYRGKGLQFEATAEGETKTITMYWNKIPWHFVKTADAESYTYLTVFHQPDEIVNAPYAFGYGMEKSLTGRVYLWNRTIPLLPDYLLTGCGPDAFALVFPQNDYLGQANTEEDMLNQIITRPHSYYLQTAIQTGLLSLLALLIFFGQYLSGTCRMLWSSKEAELLQDRSARDFQIVLLLSVVGYLFMGLANDSVVVTSPLFWALLGMGCGKLPIAVNHREREKHIVDSRSNSTKKKGGKR